MASQDAEKVRGGLFGGSPLLQQGELDFSPAEKRSRLKWTLAAGFSEASAKAHDQSRSFFPRINAGAPTQKAHSLRFCTGFFSSLFSRAVRSAESWASAPEGLRTSPQHRSPSVAKATTMTAAYGTAESRAPSKREVPTNNPGEAPHYPYKPDTSIVKPH